MLFSLCQQDVLPLFEWQNKLLEDHFLPSAHPFTLQTSAANVYKEMYIITVPLLIEINPEDLSALEENIYMTEVKSTALCF